ncbi:MAG: AraC family transcriptional regulator [Candidatus Eremiobacteraeota bacterium]|nr:AraC family transcriptional regulator [Candidatus Eremiobacteraeota bacterium]
MATIACECIGASVATEDSHLGRWTAARWSPPPASPLCGMIERIWYFDGVLANAKERVFPDGRAELIVMLDEPHRDGDVPALTPFPAVCINGLRTRPSVVIAPPGRCRVLGVRFEAAGACALMRGSMKALLDVTIDVRDELGRRAERLGERCADAAETASSNPARNAMLVLRVAAEWVFEMIDRDIVERIAAEVGLSRPRFVQRFSDRVGVTPKRFARIVRFRNALAGLQRASIADTAAELAYYDQAHMHRDFAEFAGMTPGAFIAANRYPGSPSLAEP